MTSSRPFDLTLSIRAIHTMAGEWVWRMGIVLALLVTGVTAASAETLLMPPRDFLAGTAAKPFGPGASGEVVWGVTTQPNHNTGGIPTTYEFDFGDGTAPVTGNVSDRSYIVVNHVFLGTGELTVRLRVTRSGVTETATTKVRVFNGGTATPEQLRGVNTNRAIQDGLRYLWVTQNDRANQFPGNTQTSWPGYPPPYTALVITAFQNHGYHVPNSANAPTGLYEKYIVRRGLNYIINELEPFNLTMQQVPNPTPGNPPINHNPCVGAGAGPDPDGAGAALCVGLQESYFHQGYATSMAMMPLAASNALNRTVIASEVPQAYMHGKTYGEILQRLVNGLAWGQGECGNGRGGWYYSFNACGTDGSTIGWNVLSLLDAEAAGIDVPDFVKDEFINYAIPLGLNDDGTFDYSACGNPGGPCGIGNNMAKAGIGVQAMFYAGMVGIGNQRVLAGRNAINARWNTADPGDQYYCDTAGSPHNKGCGYAMFNVFKALKLQGITTLPNVTRPAGPGNIPAGDWYADYVDWLIANQDSPTHPNGGNWPQLDFSCCDGARESGSVALAELILSPVALIAPDPTLFSTVGLGPSTALLTPFGQHTVTATATSAGGAAVAGATVDFKVLTGPNAGKSGQVVTNESGRAVFTYTDTGGPGRDTVQAFIGTLGSNVVEAIWSIPDCSPQQITAALSSPIFPIDQGWRAVTINGAPGAKVTQVCQDEPPNFENIAAWAVDAQGVGTAAASIRAQRSGTRTNPGNGRVYTIYFTAGACKGTVTVGVPLVANGSAVNDGARYNSETGGACEAPVVPNVTSVPNVVGQTQANAASLLGTASLALGTVSQINHATVPYGQVISQLPQAGANVAVGSAVAVTVSSGPQSVAVPNVVNQPQGSATLAITGAGLTPSVLSVHDNAVAAGLVISQSIPPGTQVQLPTTVLLTVSLGKQMATVPNVVGLPLQGAVSTVGGAGLNFGAVNLVYSNTVPDGIVISQSPAAGTQLAPGAFVNFDISQGPQPIAVPNLAGQNQAGATAAILAANFAVGNVSTAHHATVPEGQVINQIPSFGSVAKPGSEVAFSISLGPVMVTVPTVVNQPELAAKTAVTTVGLAVGTVTPQNHPTVPAGQVVSQSPVGSTSVPLGSAVNLVVSLGPTPVIVPNLVGLSQANATQAIANASLVSGTVTLANSPSVPTGNVMGQNPLAGSSVLPNTPVSIVVSKGPVIVTVPNVLTQTQAQAQAAIAGAQLFLQSITFITDAATAGTVIAQTPAGGASAVLGSPMTLTVSLGTNNVTVPNVIGKTEAAAATLLSGAGLVKGTVTTTTHPSVPAGNVIDQSPAGNTVAPQGAGVNLLVSLGPVSTTVPNVVNKLQAAAVGDLTGVGLAVSVTFGTSPTIAEGRVISQQPNAGASVGEGSTVHIVVSTGLSAAVVPNVVGKTEAEAATALVSAGLVKGTVTQQSSAQPIGAVISQTPAAGSSAAGGASVNLVLSTGPESGVPAFLELTLSSQVLSAGNTASMTSSVLDGFSVPIFPVPGVIYQVVPGVGATGSAPYVTGDQLFTAADTRGAYTLRGTVNGTVVTDDVPFSVFDGSATAKNAAKFVKLGLAEQTVKGKIDALLQAYQNIAPASDVTAAKNALAAALATVPITGPNAMQRSTAVALERRSECAPNCFLPSLAMLQTAGFPVTGQDEAFGNLIGQITEKLDEIRSFFNALDPDATAGVGNAVAQLTVLNTELDALVDQLGTLNPTPAGIVKFAPQLNRLLGHTIPQHLHEVGKRAISIAAQYPDPSSVPTGIARMQGASDFFAELNARRQVLTPGSFYRETQPAFFGLVGMMSGMSLQMDLVNRIYGPILWEVSDMMSVLIANSVFQNYVSSASIGDIVSGASLSFHAPKLGGSQIEGYGLDTTWAGGNETWFIGTEAFSLVRDLIQSFDASEVESVQDVWDFFEGIANAVNASFEGYENAHTQGDDIYQGGCLLDDSFGCTALIFNEGFPDVTTGRFPSPVIIILHNTSNGSWSSGMFNFVP